MKTATEIAKLHSLFLSQEPANWELAAMMCSETEFEEVMTLEIERLKEDESFNLEVKKDPDEGTCIDILYKYQLILGSKYVFEFWVWNIGGSGIYSTSLAREFNSEAFTIWSDCEYDEDAIRRNDDPFAVCGSINKICKDLSNNQFLDEYLKRELEAIKEHWRWQFNQIKAELAAQ